jgi:hypothetical protein
MQASGQWAAAMGPAAPGLLPPPPPPLRQRCGPTAAIPPTARPRSSQRRSAPLRAAAGAAGAGAQPARAARSGTHAAGPPGAADPWISSAAHALRSGACSAATVVQLAEAAAGRAVVAAAPPPPHVFAEALCAAAAAVASRPPSCGGLTAQDAVRLAAALASARVPAPAALRAALAARIEGGAWELSAAALSAAAGQLQRMGHIWSVPAACAFVERAADSGSDPERQGGAVAGIEPAAAAAELLLALQPALLQQQQAQAAFGTSGSSGSGGCSSVDGSVRGAITDSSDGEGDGDSLSRLWARAVGHVAAAADQWRQQQLETSSSRADGSAEGSCRGSAPAEASAPPGQDPVPSVLMLIRALCALQPRLRQHPASHVLLVVSQRLAAACPLHQLVPLVAAWRALGSPFPSCVVLRVSREPLGPLSSAKLAALAGALAGVPPGARGARRAAVAVAAEVSARLAAGRLPPAAAAQATAALPRLLRLGWPADAAAALLAAVEAGVGALAPVQLWELHQGLEQMAPRWEAAAVTTEHAWAATTPEPAPAAAPSPPALSPLPPPQHMPSPGGLLPRPVFPMPRKGAGNACAAADDPVAVRPAEGPASGGSAPAYAALAQLQRLESKVRAALAQVPAERLPIGAAPPAISQPAASGSSDRIGAGAHAGGARGNGHADEAPGGSRCVLSPRRQVLALLLQLRGLLASPALTPGGLAAVCVSAARLFGTPRLRRAAKKEARQLESTRRALEATAWVWMQGGGSSSEADTSGGSVGSSSGGISSMDTAPGAAAQGTSSCAQAAPGGSLDAVQLMLVLRALVALGADPHAGVAGQVAAAAHAALRGLPPPRLAAALRRLAALRLQGPCPSWDALLLRLLVAHVTRMAPADALACGHAAVLRLRFRPAPAIAGQLLHRLLEDPELPARPQGALLQTAQLAAALRAACAGAGPPRAPPMRGTAASETLLSPRTLTPLLHALTGRMAAFNGRQLVAVGGAVAAWGASRAPGFGAWMEKWLVLLRARALELTTVEVSKEGRAATARLRALQLGRTRGAVPSTSWTAGLSSRFRYFTTSFFSPPFPMARWCSCS